MIDLAAADARLASLWETVRDIPAQASVRALQSIDRASWFIVGMAEKERFTGKGPFPPSQRRLGVVSGHLRRALKASKPEVSDEGEVTVRFSAGGVEYWPVHEFGFSGRVEVAAHTRTTESGSQSVRAHSREVSIDARAPFQAAIDDHAEDEYTAATREGLEALVTEMKKGGEA